MPTNILYQRRTNGQLRQSEQIEQIFPDWKGDRERWLFLAPHDDDIVCGCGLTFQAAITEGIEVHAVITTDGRMGYCRLEQREIISQTRCRESEESFRALGLAPQRLHFLRFPDGGLGPYRGRRFCSSGDPAEIQGAVGLQNSFTFVLRKIRPTRVFLPTLTDIHPDHQATHEEMLISLFHAQGGIWPELGPVIESIPSLYEYATYCDFRSPPDIRLVVPEILLERKLDAIRAYASQEQIEMLVDVQRRVGPIEYIRELKFNVFDPSQYEQLFES